MNIVKTTPLTAFFFFFGGVGQAHFVDGADFVFGHKPPSLSGPVFGNNKA